MSVYADSSFLASLYLPDGHFAAANQFMQTAGFALRSVTEAEARRVLSLIQQDTNTGQLVPTACDWEAVYGQAELLSERYTLTGGHRALDVQHVASALVLGATDFLTFDQRQAELARHAGLVVLP